MQEHLSSEQRVAEGAGFGNMGPAMFGGEGCRSSAVVEDNAARMLC